MRGSTDDDVSNRLRPVGGVDDDLGLAPGLSAVDGLGEVGGAGVGRRVRVVVRVVRGQDQRVPDGIGGLVVDRVGGGRVLVGALVSGLEEGSRDRLDVVPGRAAVGRARRDDRVLRPLHAAGSLRAGLDFDEALATFCALASPESYWLLTDEFGWSAARWERWLAGCGVRLFVEGGP